MTVSRCLEYLRFVSACLKKSTGYPWMVSDSASANAEKRVQQSITTENLE
jgi:hypothetical protein